jgi:hypothetical protein
VDGGRLRNIPTPSLRAQRAGCPDPFSPGATIHPRLTNIAGPTPPLSHPQVYDLSPYVNEHPGGVEAMMRNAGGDATAGFHGPQHPARVFDIIDDFEVGGLAED